MMKRVGWYTIIMLFPLLGCAKVGKIPELLMLKSYGDQQAVTDKYVDAQEEKFKVMKQEMTDGLFDKYTNKSQIIENFGEPVFIQPSVSGAPNEETWMYRRPVNFFNSDKAFLYFDGKGKLLSYKLERYID